jgi:flotillin
VEAVKGVNIDRVVVLDGGSGKGVQNAINQRVQGALGTLEGVSSAFGVDIQSVIQGAARKIASPEADE